MIEFITEGINKGLNNMTWLEAIAASFGIISVIFSILKSIWVYPTGIISVCIYVYICFTNKLYADTGINVYYFIMSVYGWYIWSQRDPNDPSHHTPVTINSRQQNIISIVITILFWVLITLLLSNTDSDVVYFDAFTTSFAMTGMYLMAKKKVENWIAWIITDLASIPLYIHKGLIFTAVQFFVFLILAIIGLIAWIKTYKREHSYELQ
ncbi:nicotinamide riboside transporter PnuC [Marinigracilibium pacificum]|uniref:Nicotinamide riboside transporter PnuC n=1 Tax=Marinigracilibium pacificum TaxID=2729599 RepID=A0A848IUD5_9BACT|nr:nicotinamide riboside transporter PnuC [Marinigracilibium pacificum]NMM46821.1 nicotinamide mononucleotide transporter [Marinigracilibium pacificum]